MRLTKRQWSMNRCLWLSFLCYFSLALFFSSQAFSASDYLLTRLGINQIPIALGDNDSILIGGRSSSQYILVNGIRIPRPEGATIDGLNEVSGESPFLTLVGRTQGENTVQVNQWQLTNVGINPIETAEWENTSLSIPDGTIPSRIIGINDQGTVLGQGQSTTGNPVLFYIDVDPQGFPHFNPPVHRDFPLSDYPQSEARAINASGDIVGVLTDTNGTKHSYLYQAQEIGSGRIIANTLSDNYIASEAFDLSDRNANGDLWVVGKAQIGTDRWQAYVAMVSTTDDKMQAIDTDTLNGGNSVANSVNNAGEVVGQAQNSEGEDRAFLYHINQETFVDLNDSQSNFFGLVSGIATHAIAINQRGSIVGTYTYKNFQYGYLLTSAKQDPSFYISEQSISCLPTALDCPLNLSARAIAIDKGWMALGQYKTNKVTLLQQGLDGSWFYHDMLEPNDTVEDIRFGFSVALHEKRLVVGADGSANTPETLNVGAIYVYEYNNATATWDLDQKILPNSSEVIADLYFGRTVSIYDNRILVTTMSDNPSFFYIKSALTWQESIISETSQSGRMGESFAIFNKSTTIYPVTDDGLEMTPTLIPSSLLYSFNVTLHGHTVAGTTGVNSPIQVFHNKNNQWYRQAQINRPPYGFSGQSTLYADTLVATLYSSNTLYFYNRSEETWRFQARHPLEFSPGIIRLNRNILAVSQGNSTKLIKIFSLTPPDSDGVDLTVTVDGPTENIASNLGDQITFQATVTNQDPEREAWNIHLQIDIANDSFIANESDSRCTWLAEISKVNCVLGNVPAQTSMPSLAIALQHQNAQKSDQIKFTVVQQGPNPHLSDTLIIDAPMSDANATLTVTPSRSEIAPNGTVNLTLILQNSETYPIAALLTMSKDISVAYAGDSCDVLESPCDKVREFPDLRYIVKVPPEQEATFTVSLRFPTAGNYDITVDVPLFSNIPIIILPIQVGPNVTDIRINHKAQYILKENESMPALSLIVRNWSLENTANGKHIDWSLLQNSTLVKEGHTLTTSVSLGPLEPGSYTLEVRLVDNNHGSTDYKDAISLTVQRPTPTVTILFPTDNSTLRLSPGIGFDLQLVVENWSMRAGGKHYRWVWDGEETGNATALSLTLSPENLAEGAHQLIIELIDENGAVLAKSNTITVTIEHPNDVTVHWRNMPETVLIEQTIPVELTLINNNQQTPATGVELILTTTLIELTETTPLPSGCELTTSTKITCQFPSLTASEQRELSFAFTHQQDTATLSAAITQTNPIDPVPPLLTKTIQIIDPIDLSIQSTWPATDVKVNQRLQPTFTVTNHSDRTATALTINGPYPARLRLLNSIPSECVIEGKTWQCSLDTLAPGDSRDIPWSFIAVASGSVDYQVTVINAQEETNPDNNTQTTQLTLTQPNTQITILQPSSTQTIYRHPSPTDPQNYLSSVQLHYRIKDWDLPHQVTINGELVATRSQVSPLDITRVVIDGSNTIVIQLLDWNDAPVSHPTAQMTLTVAEGTIVDVPKPMVSERGALGGWLLLGLGWLGWRRLLPLSRQSQSSNHHMMM